MKRTLYASINILLFILSTESTEWISHYRHNVNENIVAEKPEPNCEWEGMTCTCLEPNPPGEVPPPKELWDLLEEGQEFLSDYPLLVEAIFLLGNTGVGKTTATQIIGGDLSKLHAVVNSGKSGLVIIDEEERIGLPSTESKTLLPELVMKELPPLAFYDFPGFDDNRGPTKDIAANFFMTEVMDKVEKVKLLFLAAHNDVKEGGDRNAFDLLAEHATTFVKEIEKFPNSYALIINKVECTRCSSDDTVINGIVSFLRNYNTTLHNDLENPEKDQERIQHKIIFVKHILQENADEQYPKIYFIKLADYCECGPLSDCPLMVSTEQNIANVYNSLSYVPIEKNMFGFTLKDNTKLKLPEYIADINNIISEEISDAIKKLEVHHEDELKNISTNLQDLLSKLLEDENVLSSSLEEIAELTEDLQEPLPVANILESLFSKFGSQLPTNFTDVLSQQQIYLEFFDNAANQRQDRNIRDWVVPAQQFLRNVTQQLTEAKTKIPVYVDELNEAISRNISAVTAKLEARYFNKLYQNEDKLMILNTQMDGDANIFKMLQPLLEMKSYEANASKVFDIIKPAWHVFRVELPIQLESLLNRAQADFEFLDNFLGFRQTRKIDDWRKSVKEFDKAFENHKAWYSFCRSVEVTSQGYNFQDTKPKPPSSTPVDWLKFLEEQTAISVPDSIKEIAAQLGEERRRLLQKLMEFALGESKVICDLPAQTLSIQGNFIRIKEFVPQLNDLRTKCGGNIRQFDFYAAHTIFLDSDVTMNGDGVVLMAPNFTQPIRAEWKLSVKGKTGATRSPSAESNGKHGCMGVPGGPGGHAIIVATNLQSIFKVTVDASGGQGGLGQHGGKGIAGKVCGDAAWFNGKSWGSPPTCEYSGDNWVHCYNHGCPEANGLTGGNGGDGGLGGKNGGTVITVFNDDGSTVKEEIVWEGAKGQPGNGGAGGAPGRKGKGFACNEGSYRCVGVAEQGSSPGRDGQAGTSKSCAQNQVAAVPLENWRSLLNYRLAFLNHTHPATNEFLELFDSSTEVNWAVTLKRLADEYLALEALDKSRITKERLSQLYSSLIRRLGIYSNERYAGSSLEHQKVISLLLTSSYGYLTGLRNPLGLDIMVDMIPYFEDITKQIQAVTSISDGESMRKYLNEGKNTFHGKLVEKISNVLTFMTDIATPAMIEASKDVEGSLVELEEQLDDSVEMALTNLEEARGHLIRAEKEQKLHRIYKLFAITTDTTPYLFPPLEKSFADIVQDLEDKYAGDREKLEYLDELVKESEKVLETLQANRERHQAGCAPFVDKVLTHFSKVSESLRTGENFVPPQLGLLLSEVVSRLEDCRASLIEFSDDEVKVRNLVNAFDRMRDGFTMSIDLYEMMDHFIENMETTRYISQMQSATLAPVEIKDPQFIGIVKNFDARLKSNLLELEVKKAWNSFKQWVFPFATFYSLPEAGSSGAERLRQVDHLKKELEEYKKHSVGGRDISIIQSNFSSGVKSGKPFFVWRKENWGKEIHALLAGQTVNFDADVALQGFHESGWEAIKFKQIEINLKLNDAPDGYQEEFDDIIEYFGVAMTHSGISYIRFQKSYFVMTGPNHTLIYNFERDSTGNRLGTNVIYQKFKSGEYQLSPFTVWTLQLNSVVPSAKKIPRSIGFEDLTKFVPYVDLELEGIGTHIKGEEALKAAEGNLHLDDHYSRISIRTVKEK